MHTRLPANLGMRFEDDGVEYFLCSVLNDRSLISIPVDMVEHVREKAEIEEIIWPLGAYVIFQPHGMTLAIFGRANGEFVHRGGQFDFGEDKPTTLGVSIWNLWQALRDTDEGVLQENLKQLVHDTLLSRETCEELSPEALEYFQAQYARFAAETLEVSSHRVSSRLCFIESGYVMAELYLDGKILDAEDERHKTITQRFERYLATAKPN